MPEEEYKIIDAMLTYGGNFVQSLAEAAHRADVNNYQKLKNAFPEYWKQYEEMANTRNNHAKNSV